MDYRSWDKNELIKRALLVYNHDFRSDHDKEQIIEFLDLEDTIAISKLSELQQNDPIAVARALRFSDENPRDICSRNFSEKFMPGAGLLDLDQDIPVLLNARSELTNVVAINKRYGINPNASYQSFTPIPFDFMTKPSLPLQTPSVRSRYYQPQQRIASQQIPSQQQYPPQQRIPTQRQQISSQQQQRIPTQRQQISSQQQQRIPPQQQRIPPQQISSQQRIPTQQQFPPQQRQFPPQQRQFPPQQISSQQQRIPPQQQRIPPQQISSQQQRIPPQQISSQRRYPPQTRYVQESLRQRYPQ